MKTKYVDIPAIVQVIGGIYNNPSLLDNEDKYHFLEEDFTEEFHKILFGSIYNLYKMGVQKIGLGNIEDYLVQKPKSYSIYKSNNGSEYLIKISNNTQLSAFDYYYNRVKKMTLFRAYEDLNMDLSWLYDPNNILNVKKKQEQEEWFDNTSLEEIAEIIDDKITDIRLKYINNAENESHQAAEGVLDLLEKLKKEPEVGCPLFGSIINTITRGARLSKFYLRSAPSGIGKALPNSTIIPTPTGDKKVKEIKIGDYLFDAFGKPTKVLGVFPQGKKEVWEIVLGDDRKAKCCEEHLWSYCTEGQKNKSKKERKFYTSSLSEINKKSLKNNDGSFNILIPMQKAVEYTKKEYYIKPYSFGLLLGDGSFRYSKNQKALSYSSENEELPNAIANEMNWNVKKNSEHNYNWIFEWKDNEKGHLNVWVEEILKDFPLLCNVASIDKFIPEIYLQGSIEQRFELLNGLLDSDGSIDKNKGRISYFTISPKLRDDVTKLARSLGFKVSVTEDKHKDTNICYILYISGSPEDKIKLFKLKRKKELIMNWYNNGKRKNYNNFSPIKEINNLGYYEEMTCFLVDNKEHLFLTNDFIVTHNSRAIIADCCYIGCDELYDNTSHSWIKNGTKESCLYISTELGLDEVQTMMIAFISDVDEEHILNGYYEDGEWERVVKASNILKNSKIYVQQLFDFSLKDLENCIKVSIRENKTKYIFHDYIHSSLKILSEISSSTSVKGLREDNILFMISTRLKDICNEYGIFILSSTQLNGGWKTETVFDQNLLRGAKSIADKIDMGWHILGVTETDISSLEPILGKHGFETPKLKMPFYKNRRGKYTNLILWCRDRRGVCKIEPMFATTYQYELIEIDDLKIEVEESAF